MKLQRLLLPLLVILALLAASRSHAVDPPNPPEGLKASVEDGKIVVSWQLPGEGEPPATGYRVLLKRVLSEAELAEIEAAAHAAKGDASDEAAQAAYDRVFTERMSALSATGAQPAGEVEAPATTMTVTPPLGEGTWEVILIAIGADGSEAFPGEPAVVELGGATGAAAPMAATAPATPAAMSWQDALFDKDKTWLAVMVAVLCASVLLCIQLARAGKQMWVRRIAALEAVDEAVGRATEMGRRVLFVPGVQDMDDIGTIAGVSILGRVAKTAATYGADLEVPTSKSLVMTACRETVQASYYEAGRPDAYNADRIPYITDDQFGYVAYLVGDMVRTKPAACLYMGAFFAESLLLAETGNSIGAIQIAGTREPAQLPFFVAACDYTLIGEEFFAASAYLSKQPDQLGSLKGQDLCKLILGSLMIVGCLLATLAAIWPDSGLQRAVEYIRFVILG